VTPRYKRVKKFETEGVRYWTAYVESLKVDISRVHKSMEELSLNNGRNVISVSYTSLFKYVNFLTTDAPLAAKRYGKSPCVSDHMLCLTYYINM